MSPLLVEVLVCSQLALALRWFAPGVRDLLTPTTTHRISFLFSHSLANRMHFRQGQHLLAREKLPSRFGPDLNFRTGAGEVGGRVYCRFVRTRYLYRACIRTRTSRCGLFSVKRRDWMEKIAFKCSFLTT